MRVRHIIVAAGITFTVAGAIWIYDNIGGATATGAGGLPLITANTTPIRTEPTEPGGEVIPHADSTIFAAMSRGQNGTPSMEGLKLPTPQDDTMAEQPATSPEFAGLKTGFSLPTTPEPRVESLFTTDEGEAAPETSRYVSGISDIQPEEPPVLVAENTELPEIEPEKAPAPAATPVVEKPVVKTEQPVVVKEKPQTPEPVSDQPDQPQTPPMAQAQVMEEQEKRALTASIPAPAEKPAHKPQPKAEPEQKAATPPQAKKPEPIAPIVRPTQTAQATSTPTPLTPKPLVEPILETSAGQSKPTPATPAPAPASTSDEHVIQLASMPSRAEAERSWLKFTSMYPEALRGLSPSYVEVEIPGRGTFTRLRAGTTTRADANARCEQIRREDPKAGGCLVIRK